MCRHTLRAGPGFSELSLSVGDVLASVLMMYFNFVLFSPWWLFVVGTSVVSRTCSQDKVVWASSWYSTLYLLCSRLRKSTAFFPSSLRSSEFEDLEVSQTSEGSLWPDCLQGSEVQCFRLYCFLAFNSGQSPNGGWAFLNERSFLSVLYYERECRRPDSPRGSQSCTRNSAELGVRNSLGETHCQK